MGSSSAHGETQKADMLAEGQNSPVSASISKSKYKNPHGISSSSAMKKFSAEKFGFARTQISN